MSYQFGGGYPPFLNDDIYLPSHQPSIDIIDRAPHPPAGIQDQPQHREHQQQQQQQQQQPYHHRLYLQPIFSMPLSDHQQQQPILIHQAQSHQYAHPSGLLAPFRHTEPFYSPFSILPGPPTTADLDLSPSPVLTLSSVDETMDQDPLADVPGKTNWQPGGSARLDHAVDLAASTSSSSVQVADEIDATAQFQPRGTVAKARARRAAASKARSNIAEIASSMRSPPPSAVSSIEFVEVRPHSRTASITKQGGHSRTSSRASFRPQSVSENRQGVPLPFAMNQTDLTSTAQLLIPVATNGKTRKVEHIQLKNHRGYLLPAEPDAILEVNDLLILQPPSIEPINEDLHKPRNQYSGAPAPEGYKSVYEMYTCRVCSKTYDGKNARSVARRHLQDKHGVPLSIQARRTRWDGEDRPKDMAEAHDRSKKAKRDWAQKRRLLSRLERVHGDFLEGYGSGGIITPSGTHLIAFSLRRKGESASVEAGFATRLDWPELPKHLRDQVVDIEGVKLPFKDNVASSQGSSHGEFSTNSKVRNISKTKNAHDSLSISAESWTSERPALAETASNGPGALTAVASSASPGKFAHSAPDFGLKRTPIAKAREGDYNGLFVPSTGDWTSWRNDSQTESELLQKVIEQHHAKIGNFSEEAMLNTFAAHTSLAADNQSDRSSEPTPEPITSMGEMAGTQGRQDWVAEEEGTWASEADAAEYNTRSAVQSFDNSWTATLPAEHDLDVRRDKGVEAVAAESLLNLHSTPARAEEPSPARSDSRLYTNEELSTSSRAAGVVAGSLLEAPIITPQPGRPLRANSLVKTFAKQRQSMSRSMSYNDQNFDDPFAFTPSNVFGDSGSSWRKRRHTLASPSPLSLKRKKQRDGKEDHSGSPRLPMSIIHPNSNAQLDSHATSTTATSDLPNRPAFGSTTWKLPFGVSNAEQAQATLLSTSMITPQRPARDLKTDPGQDSLIKSWIMSSPGEGGTAASLGLIPQWGAHATPGLSGVEASDTPARK